MLGHVGIFPYRLNRCRQMGVMCGGHAAGRGRSGGLGKVRSDLIDLVGFMSGMDREHVEAFLNDAE